MIICRFFSFNDEVYRVAPCQKVRRVDFKQGQMPLVDVPVKTLATNGIELTNRQDELNQSTRKFKRIN